MTLKERARLLKIDIPALIISLKEKDTPIFAKVLTGILVVYVLSPIDLIPDFIPVLGYMDDLIIVPALIALAIRMIPNEVLERCRKQSSELWKDGKPNKWYYAIPFILIWIIALFAIIRAIFSHN